MNLTVSSHGLSNSTIDEIRRLYCDEPQTDPEELLKLEEIAEKLIWNPKVEANYIKGYFVSAILSAMQALGFTQSVLAKKWGRSRQYLSKILREEERVNFTVDSMVELAFLVGKQLRIQLVDHERQRSESYAIPMKRTPYIFQDPFTSSPRKGFRNDNDSFIDIVATVEPSSISCSNASELPA